MLGSVVDHLSHPGLWLSFLTLSLLEIVLGIDNVVFLALVSNRLPASRRMRARFIGLSLAFVMRVIFLVSIVWVTSHLFAPVYTIEGYAFSWRDFIFLGGGAFLLVKATLEIHDDMERREKPLPSGGRAMVGLTIVQIVVLDLVFSIDSIMTAVGLSQNLLVMIAAIVVAMLVMLSAAGPVGVFIAKHPTVKMLALAFLLLIGVVLIADGLHFHIPRGYLYSAIAFSLFVEMLNMMARGRRARNDDSG